MTTPDPGKRKTRPKEGRTRPIRKGEGVRARSSAARSPEQAAASMDEAVARAVQSSYDVLDEAVRQTRTAADRFSEGDLSLKTMPVDIASVSLKAIDIARQLSTATLDLCEQMVSQINLAAAPPPPGEVAAKVPPFRKTTPEPVHRSSSPSPENPDVIPFEVHFTGGGKAVAHSSEMKKPQKVTRPGDLMPLSLLKAGSSEPGLACEPFEMDISGALSVQVKVPKGQAPGVYNGLIMAKGQDIPLGILTVEVLEGA